MEETQKKHLEILKNRGEDLVKRIKSAVRLELDYWDQKTDPPNLTEDHFKMVLGNIGKYVNKFTERKSEAGKYGKTGELSVFNLEFSVPAGRFDNHYYLKGYFFEENDLKGVCIQSFRLKNKTPRGRGSLRLV